MQFIGDIIVIRRTYEILNLGYFCFQKIRSLEAKCASLEKKVGIFSLLWFVKHPLEKA
jgi:hypothetical protein